jgi:hypothetical protein
MLFLRCIFSLQKFAIDSENMCAATALNFDVFVAEAGVLSNVVRRVRIFGHIT